MCIRDRILEAVRYSVVGYEMEEFMHGVYHSIDQDTYLLYLGCPGKHYQRMVNMMKYFGERDHAHNYMVTSEKEQESKENFVYPFQNDPYFASKMCIRDSTYSQYITFSKENEV